MRCQGEPGCNNEPERRHCGHWACDYCTDEGTNKCLYCTTAVPHPDNYTPELEHDEQ